MQLMSNRKIAYILTLVCYREVECWEQYHTEHKKLDLCIYREMLFEIRTKLDFYLPFTKYMRMGKDEWIAHEKSSRSRNRIICLALLITAQVFMNGSLRSSLMHLMVMILLNIFYQDGSNWLVQMARYLTMSL